MYYLAPVKGRKDIWTVLGNGPAGNLVSFGEFSEMEAKQVAAKMNMLHPDPAVIDDTPDDMVALLGAI